MVDFTEVSRTQRLLASLRDSIIDKPPYISRTMQLPDSRFSLFYQAIEDGAARRINLAHATPDELEQLFKACEPASFGINQENVLDETYRKAGKMDSERFSPMLDLHQTDLMKLIRGYLLEGTDSTEGIKAELYKLNVYGKGSFFKPHVDTPRSDLMFGSLVLVFPTLHDGGVLLLRHRGHEWTFDSGEALAAADQPSIGYVAFFSDIEHEVTPVISGHRVTLTYNLYFEDDGDDYANKAVSKRLTLPNKGAFREAFTALLENPEFLADGGTLAFGLRHVYPIKKDLSRVHMVLKGSDAVVYQSLQALGYEPKLYVFYNDEGSEGAIIDEVIKFPVRESEEDVVGIVYEKGGSPTAKENTLGLGDRRFGKPEQLDWVTPMTEINRRNETYVHYGNESTLIWVYGVLCLIVRIGKAGERLAYPTVAALNKARSLRVVSPEPLLEWGGGWGENVDEEDDDSDIL